MVNIDVYSTSASLYVTIYLTGKLQLNYTVKQLTLECLDSDFLL